MWSEGISEMAAKKDFVCYCWFEDRGRGLLAKECGQPLEVGKGKEVDSPQNLQKSYHFDSGPVRPVSDF